MMDPSPSTHCWKTWKHRNTKLGKLKREKVGKFVLGEGCSSLQLWIMLINWTEEKNLPTPQPITPWKSPATFYPLLFHPLLNKVIMLSILPSATCSISGAIKTVYCQQRQVVPWLIKPSIYRLYKHMPPFHLRLAILAITKQHYTICDDISNWPTFRKGMKQNINKLEQTTGRHNNCSATLTSPNTLLYTQVLHAFLVSSLKSKTFQ